MAAGEVVMLPLLHSRCRWSRRRMYAMQIWIAKLACRNRNRSGHPERVRCHRKNSTAWDSPQQDNSGGRRRAPGVRSFRFWILISIKDQDGLSQARGLLDAWRRKPAAFFVLPSKSR